MKLRILPIFQEYSVDLKLRQFRKISKANKIEFVEFSSKKGQELLKKLRRNGYTKPDIIISKKPC